MVQSKDMPSADAAATLSRPARGRRLLRILPVLIPLIIAVAAGLAGLDFGSHWDEHRQLASVHRTIDRGVLLPGIYWWPSMSYWLTLSALAPDLIASRMSAVPKQDIAAYLHRAVDSHRFLLRARAIYATVSALAILWVYLLVLAWRKSWAVALVAASLLAFSWEINYHMRWIAIDVVMMQFAALTLLCVVLAQMSRRPRVWLYLAAVAAGWACASKYPAGLLLVLVLVAAYQCRERGGSARSSIRRAAALSAVFAVSYLLVTPGTIYEPIEFIRGVRFNMNVYAAGHPSHNVSPGLEHLLGIGAFLGAALFSKYDAIAVILSLLGVVGLYALVRESGRMAVTMLIMPVLYIGYFSTQRVLIVRNVLLLAPFFAVLSALGIEFLWKRWENKLWRAGLTTVITAVMLVNVGWLFYAADTIRDRGSDRFVREAAVYIKNHPATRFFVSEGVAADLTDLQLDNGLELARDLDATDTALFYSNEGFVDAAKDWRKDVPGNFMTDIATWFGPYEINWLLYTKWPANERIICMPSGTVRKLGLELP